MVPRIALVSQKGGVGKTTVALNLAVAYAETLHRRVLLVDLDPQGGVGFALAKDDTEWSGLVECLAEGRDARSVLVVTKLPRLSLLARGRLDPVDAEAFERLLRDGGHLGRVLEDLAPDFDVILIDTPSGLGAVTRAALAAATHALVPLPTEHLALRTVGQVLRVIEHVFELENPDLQLLGLLPVMVEMGHESTLDVLGHLWSGFAGVLETVIPRAEVFQRATQRGVPVSFLGGRVQPEARRFELLATELDERLSDLARNEGAIDDAPARTLV